MRSKRIKVNLLLMIFSITIGILVAEGFLRIYKPYSALGAGTEFGWFRDNPRFTQRFTIDPNFGFRPILGTKHYNEYGIRPNEYGIEKRPNVKRLLFIGDSVTNRGKIVNALKRLYGEDELEYWNAGVESFNTVQEVSFFKRYNASINPDHVILTFHLNDFETTPIAFYHEDRLVVYAPRIPGKSISPWLFRHSYLYRLLLGVSIAVEGREAIAREVQQSLEELRDILKANDIQLTILVLPLFKPYEGWRKSEVESRTIIIDILEKLDVRYFDLFDILDEAVKEGINVQDPPGDPWHPSEEISSLFAKYLYEEQVF